VTVLRIEGVPPWDGDYPIDIEQFTNRDLHMIKEVSGVRAGELGDEFARGNNDLIVAVALIAAKRNGRDIPPDDLWDAPVGKIALIVDGDADADPPVSVPASASDAPAGDFGSPPTSGGDSASTGDSPPNGLSRTGDRGWETTAA